MWMRKRKRLSPFFSAFSESGGRKKERKKRIADPVPPFFGSWIQTRIGVGRWIQIRIRIEVKIQELYRLKISRGGSRTLTMDAWRLKMEPWRVVADSNHFDKEQDSDPY
jgi:hypothetical protein